MILHDPKGVERLRSVCTDTSMPSEGLLAAIDVLQITHSSMGVCAQTVLAAISREKDIGFIAMFASRLPLMYRDVSPEQARRILDVLENLLLDQKQEFTVRLMSSEALAQIGAPESAEMIREAIPRAADPNLRASFERDLKTLEKKQ